MAFISADRVKETTTTTGTGDISFAGAMTSMRAFSSVMVDGDQCYYTIQAVDGSGIPTGDWEVGTGTFHSGGTMTRSTIRSSSTGSILSLASGTKQVWLDQPAKREGYTGQRGSTFVTHFYRGTLCVGGTYPALSLVQNGMRAIPVRIPADCLIAPTVFVTAGVTGGKQNFSLYNSRASDGLPGTLAYGFSELDVSATGQKTATAQSVLAGDYWCVYNQNVAHTARHLEGSSSTGPGFMLSGDEGVTAASVSAGTAVPFLYTTTVTYVSTPASDLSSLTWTAALGSNSATLHPLFVVT